MIPVHTRRTAAVAIIVGAALTLTTACSTIAPSTSGDDGTPTDGGTLSYAVDSLPVGAALDPILGTAPYANRAVLAQAYDTLLTRGKDGDIQAGVATEWTTDGNAYVFTIRDDLTFADGAPVTAQDVAFSLNEAAPSMPDQWVGFTSASVTESGDVRADFASSNGAFLPILSSWSGVFIISEAWYEKTSPEDRSRTTNGSGPFAVSEWEDGVSLTMTKNPTYRGADDVHLDTIEWVLAVDDTTRLAMLQQGRVQMADLSDPLIAQQAESSGFLPGSSPELRILSMLINAGDGPLADVNVRRAVSLAMNRQEVIDVGLSGAGELTLVIPPGDPGTVRPTKETPFYTQDIDKATSLLAEAGTTDVSFDLTYAGDLSAADVPALEVIKQQLAEAGITMNLRSVEWPAIAAVLGGAAPAPGLTLLPSIAQSDVSGYFASVSRGVLDFWGDSPDAVTARQLAGELISETDQKKRADIAAELSNEIADQVLVLTPAATAQGHEVLSSTVKGYTPDPYMARTSLRDAWISG